MPGISIDGSDVREVLQATHEAALRARSGGGPTLIEAIVERYLPHTSDDDDTRYRAREEVEEARKHDPLRLFEKYLKDQGILSEELDQRFQKQAMDEVNKATDESEAAPYPGVDDFYDHVYKQ